MESRERAEVIVYYIRKYSNETVSNEYGSQPLVNLVHTYLFHCMVRNTNRLYVKRDYHQQNEQSFQDNCSV